MHLTALQSNYFSLKAQSENSPILISEQLVELFELLAHSCKFSSIPSPVKGREASQEVLEASHSHSFRHLSLENHQHRVSLQALWMKHQKEANFRVVILKVHLTHRSPEEEEDPLSPSHASAFQGTMQGRLLSLS